MVTVYSLCSCIHNYKMFKFVRETIEIFHPNLYLIRISTFYYQATVCLLIANFWLASVSKSSVRIKLNKKKGKREREKRHQSIRQLSEVRLI